MHHSFDLGAPLLPILLVAFALYWCALFWIVSWMTGWRALAREFPAGERPTGQTFAWRSLRIWKLGGYNHCLNATLCDEGIYLVPAVPFRFAHPPILFPWSAVGEMRTASVIGFAVDIVPLRALGKTYELTLPREVSERVNSLAGAT